MFNDVCVYMLKHLKYYSRSATLSGMIFIYYEWLQMAPRIYVAERTIFIDYYLETSMSHARIRNDFVLLFYYTMKF